MPVMDGILKSRHFADTHYVAEWGAMFYTIQDAINFAVAQGASAADPHLIICKPHQYVERVVGAPGITLLAEGGPDTTSIYHQCTAHDQPTLTAADDFEVIGMRVISDGDGGTFRAQAFLSDGASPELENCRLVNQNSAAASITANIITDGTVTFRDTIPSGGATNLYVGVGAALNGYFNTGTGVTGGTTTDIDAQAATNIYGGSHGRIDADDTVNLLGVQVDTMAGTGTANAWDTRVTTALSVAIARLHGEAITVDGAAITSADCTWKIDNNTWKVVTGMYIQRSINAAGAGDCILVYPGTYTEQIVMISSVDIVSVAGKERTTITFTSTGSDQPTVNANNATIKGFTIISNGNTVFRARCVFADTYGFNVENCTLTMQNTAANAYCVYSAQDSTWTECSVNADNASTCGFYCAGVQVIRFTRGSIGGSTYGIEIGQCTFIVTYSSTGNLHGTDGGLYPSYCSIGSVLLDNAYAQFRPQDCTFSGNITTAGALNHHLRLRRCHLLGNNIVSNATGAATLDMDGCTEVGTITNAGTGVFNIQNSDVASVNQSNAAGSIAIIGGILLGCAGSTGTVTWRTGTNRYDIVPGMRVTHALANDRLIIVHPGTYTLTAQLLVNVARVTIRGSGKNTIFTTSVADLDIIQVTGADVTFEDFVVDGNAGGAANDIGIMVTTCDRFTALNVTSRDNGEHGFHLNRVNYAKLIGCDAISNTLDGIHLLSTGAGDSDYNKITDCTCDSNGSDGIEINEAAGGNVNDTIVSLCHLISNGGVPLNDGGTNTVDAHNVKV